MQGDNTPWQMPSVIFVNSAKIHPFWYTYIPFFLQLEIAVFCPLLHYYFKSSEWARACWVLTAPTEGPFCLCHRWPAWGRWRGMWVLEGHAEAVPPALPGAICSWELAQMPLSGSTGTALLSSIYIHCNSQMVPCLTIPSSHRNALTTDFRQGFCDGEIPDSNRSLPSCIC